MTLLKAARLTCIIAVAISGTACNLLRDSTAPTALSTDTFSGTLPLQGVSIFTVTLTEAGTVSVTLSSLSVTVTGGVGLGVGSPNGTTACTLTASTSSATPSTTAQIAVNAAAGSVCVELFDVGNLAAAAMYTVSVSHP